MTIVAARKKSQSLLQKETCDDYQVLWSRDWFITTRQRMHMKTLISVFVWGALLFASSCKDTNTVTNTGLSQQGVGQMLLKFGQPPAGITSVVATLSRSGFTTRTMHLSVADSSASGSFEDVEAGTWHLAVQAFDSTETVRFSGETDVNVQPGVTSNVALQLMPTSGRIEITVTWGGTPQDPSLLLYMPFNGNANDESGHGNNGTVSGAILATDRSGNPNRAYSFDGWNNLIEIPDLVESTTPEFSISVWAKPTDVVTRRICVYLGARTGEAWIEVDTSTFSFRAHQTNATERIASAPAVAGEFAHIVGVYRRGVSMQIWKNGVLQSTVSISNYPLNSGRFTHASSVGSYAPEWLDWGRLNDIYSWLGKIDQVRVYHRALSPAEIQALYQSGE